MWISKKRWNDLEKKVTDIEKRVQSQPLEIISALCGAKNEQMRKSGFSHHRTQE